MCEVGAANVCKVSLCCKALCDIFQKMCDMQLGTSSVQLLQGTPFGLKHETGGNSESREIS